MFFFQSLFFLIERFGNLDWWGSTHLMRARGSSLSCLWLPTLIISPGWFLWQKNQRSVSSTVEKSLELSLKWWHHFHQFGEDAYFFPLSQAAYMCETTFPFPHPFGGEYAYFYLFPKHFFVSQIPWLLLQGGPFWPPPTWFIFPGRVPEMAPRFFG